MSTKTKILVVDDDRTVCQSLKLLFSKQGYGFMSIYNPLNVLDVIESYAPTIVILDMNFTIDTSGHQGLKLLRSIRSKFAHLPIVLITGWGTMALAIEGMKIGANDFITKPWDNTHLLSAIRTILQLNQKQTNTSADSSDALSAIIGESNQINEVKYLIEKIGPTDATVLVTGESGTGKELVAEAIHDHSRREHCPFVKVNLGGISESLFESELFGHKKGAYTGAVHDREGRFTVANGGTIFLDEIGDLSSSSQVKLLRVLQERTFEPLGASESIKVDVRFVSATHRPLEQMVMSGSFREDLYYRINLIHIKLPALRERTEDIPLLVSHFLKQFNQVYGEKDVYISDQTMSWLKIQTYPGNIRQLKNTLERAWLLSSTKELSIRDLKPHLEPIMSSQTDPLTRIGLMPLDELEYRMIKKTLNYHNYNISTAAKSLGITRTALYRRMERHGLSRD